MDKNRRIKKVTEELCDETANEITIVGKELVRFVIHEAKEWVINRYKEFKSTTSKVGVNQELVEIENRISTSNKFVDIGMEKKEIAIMWAMQKLGYSEEETKKVLDLAQQAYLPKK